MEDRHHKATKHDFQIKRSTDIKKSRSSRRSVNFEKPVFKMDNSGDSLKPGAPKKRFSIFNMPVPKAPSGLKSNRESGAGNYSAKLYGSIASSRSTSNKTPDKVFVNVAPRGKEDSHLESSREENPGNHLPPRYQPSKLGPRRVSIKTDG